MRENEVGIRGWGKENQKVHLNDVLNERESEPRIKTLYKTLDETRMRTCNEASWKENTNQKEGDKEG